MAPQTPALQFSPADAETLAELFQDSRVVTEKKSVWKRVRDFFVPEEFEIRPMHEVISEKLKKDNFLGLTLNTKEEEAFLKSVVKTYLAEDDVDGEALEQRARIKWRDIKPSVIRNRAIMRENDKQTLSQKKQKELFNWILAREKELDEVKKDELEVNERVTLQEMRRKLSISYALSEENYLEAEQAKQAKLAAGAKQKEAENAYIEVLSKHVRSQKLDDRYEEILVAAKEKIDFLLTDEKAKKEIEDEATYKLDTNAKRIRYFLGWLFSLIYSLGCGITTAGAFLIVMSGGALIPLFVAILVAGFVINYAFTRKNTPEVFTYAFSGIDMFRNMFKDLSTRDKIIKGVVLGVAIVAACATGFAAGILTYTGAIGIIAFFGLSAFPPALIAVLAVISAICITTVMVRGIVKALEGKPLEKIKAFFNSFGKKRMVNVYDEDGIIIGEKPESNLARGFRIGLTVFLFVAFFAFAVVGCLLNMFSAHLSMVDIFWKTHQLALNACIGISAAIASLSVVGEFQLHMDTAKEAAKALVNPFINFYRQAKLVAQNKMYSSPKKVAIIILASLLFIPILLVNMFGNGMVAGMGSSGSAALTFSAVVAALESFIDTFRDYLEFMEEQIGDWARAASKLPSWLASIKDAFLGAGSKQIAQAQPTLKGPFDGGDDDHHDQDMSSPRKTQSPVVAPIYPAQAPSPTLTETRPLLAADQQQQEAADVKPAYSTVQAMAALAVVDTAVKHVVAAQAVLHTAATVIVNHAPLFKQQRVVQDMRAEQVEERISVGITA